MNKITYTRFKGILRTSLQKAPFLLLGFIIVTVLLGIYPGVLTYRIKNFVDNDIIEATSYGITKEFVIKIVLLVVIYSVLPIFELLSQIVERAFKEQLETIARKLVVDKETRLPFEKTEDEEFIDDLAMIKEDIGNAFFYYISDSMEAVRVLLSYLSLAFVVFLSSKLLALVIVLLLVPICYIGYVCGKKQFSTLESAENQKRYTKYLQDVMVSRETAQERKLFDFDTYVLKKWNQNYRGYLKAENRTAVKNTINMESTGIIINVLFGMILTAFAFMYFEKKVQIGIIVGILSQVVILASSLRWGVMNAFMNYSYNRQMEKKITQFLNIQDRDDERGMEISSVEQVEFLNVFFKYPGSEEYVLNNISFCINKGKSYAFVGENGSGKTTIFKLLLKQYDSYEGTIKVNGIDIRNISAKSLHAAISVVYQDYSIYPVSLVDNVITEFSWDKDKFEKTLSAMGVENLIKSMPENEHTILGKLSTDDVTLSGGLSQKIAICRSLYQNGSLFILDEPTASLDPVSELNTFSLLLNEIKDKTRIIICHRMGVAKLCDEILVLDQGALVESGNNSELYEKRGKYYEMYETQKKWYV